MRRQTIKTEAAAVPESPQGLHESAKELMRNLSEKTFWESGCQ